MKRLLNIIFAVACAVFAVTLAAAPAHASALNISLQVDFNPHAFPTDPCLGASCSLGGNVQFWEIPSCGGCDILLPAVQLGNPISIGSLAAGDSFLANLLPQDPCDGVDLFCSLGVSFGGTTMPGASCTPVDPCFPTIFAFSLGSAPSAAPQPPPILPLGAIGSNFQPGGPPIFQNGALIAYDAPVQVGTWSVTVTTVPEPASLALLAGGALALIARRKRRA